MRRLPGKYTPNAKNRSSKDIAWLTKMRPIHRCLNGEFLKRLASNGDPLATKELNRRDKIHDKNQVRKQRYIEKLAAKRKAK